MLYRRHQRHPRAGALVAAAALLAAAWVADAKAQPAGGSALQALRDAHASNVPSAAIAASSLSPVREAALRDTARVLGAQAGLGEASRNILERIRSREREYDAAFRFSELLIGVGILPAVITEVQNAVAIDGPVMRVSARIYRIDEPARPVLGAPTWRDWLLVGLSPELRPAVPADPLLLPRDQAEQRYWRQQLEEGFAAGQAQAMAIFETNLARLERTYKGMRLFYDLYRRGQVTAPKVIAVHDVINREDPNTVAVGSTVFRIVQATDFVEQTDAWRPLGK